MSVEPYLRRWELVRDGEAFETPSSALVPVRFRGEPAMLKVPHDEEERFGGVLMRWWDGEGAARVLALDEDSGALVMERATGPGDLAELAASDDDAATRILCAALGRLHAPRAKPWPELMPLDQWFEALPRAASREGGPFGAAWKVARELLATQDDLVPLHGDLHHGNVLDFGARGWLAIDPKRVEGERVFDYVNMMRNPDPTTVPTRKRFARQAGLVAQEAGLDRKRLLRWTLAFAGLSAAWIAEDEDAERLADLEILAMAEAELAS